MITLRQAALPLYACVFIISKIQAIDFKDTLVVNFDMAFHLLLPIQSDLQ